MTSGGEGPFEVTGGSVLGRDHLLAGRNNQDAFGWRQDAAGLAAVVCDGCGSAPRSEVGAVLFARLLPELFLRGLARGLVPGRDLLDEVQREAIAKLRVVAEALGGDRRESVHDFFLFTIVGAVLHERGACLFSLGDGLALLNSERIDIGPFEGNAPPYLAYGLCGREVSFTLHRALPLSEVRTILLGTDGAAALPNLGQLVEDDRTFRNRDALRRHLALANREVLSVEGGRLRRTPGALSDDTTLIAMRRRREA